MQQLVVSVFGASRLVEGTVEWETAETLGRLLAQAGYTVQTGGYSGTMEAVSKGAQEAGGHVIGVTVGIFDLEGGSHNPYIDEVIRYDTLVDRLLHLVTQADALIGLPGGIGTLSEVSLAWSLIQTRELAPRPFVLIGWEQALENFRGDGRYIPEKFMRLYRVAESAAEAAAMVEEWTTPDEA